VGYHSHHSQLYSDFFFFFFFFFIQREGISAIFQTMQT
jgi:hypothetical protein